MDAKDEIKRRLSIEDVVADYLELKRAGRNFKALSPFNAEKTASFMVSPEKQIWYDFSSNRGGDMFSFIMEVEGIDFRQSLEVLAKKANVELSDYQKRDDGGAAKLKKRLLLAHEAAVAFYHICLSRQSDALEYIKNQRHFTPETIRTWKLGYSPGGGAALYEHLKKHGFTDGELEKSGLVTRRHGRLQDMFRGRIMIPLADGQGAIVGFTSRILVDDGKSGPKYLNTTQTLIYDKGRQVFGLHHAKQAIRQQDSAVLVEGNLDVIASHQAGIKNVVAAAGTAMTADHLRSLSRLSFHVRLAFDADVAGLKATERAIAIAQTIEIDLRVVQLPEGVKDPDELIQNDQAAWQAAIESAPDATTWTLKRYETLYDKSTAEGKKQLSTKALAVISGLQDPVEREQHLKMLAEYLGISLSALLSKMKQTKQRPVTKKPLNAKQLAPDETMYENDLIALNAAYPAVRESLQILGTTKLSTQQRQDFVHTLKALPAHERVTAAIAPRLKLDTNYVKILSFTAEEKYASWTPAELTAEAMALARRIVEKSKKANKNELTAAIHTAEAKGDMDTAAKLLDQYQQLLQKD